MQGTHSNKIKERIAAKAGLTQDGIDWCLEVLDPFPDYAQRLVGECDAYQSKTVPRKPKKSFTVKKPASVTSDTWDVLIFTTSNLLPYSLTDFAGDTQTPMTAPVVSSGEIRIVSDSYFPLQFITAYAVPTGSPMWPTADSFVETNTDRFSGVSFEEFAQDRVRMIGGAVEVTNDTAELYKGGHMYIADVPLAAVPQISSVFRADFQNFRANLNTEILGAPPANPAQMKLIPGCISQAAEDGAYAVLRRTKLENPFSPSLPKCLVYTQSADISTDQTGSSHYDMCVMNPGTWEVTSTSNTFIPKQLLTTLCPTNMVPFDIKCIMFTGLLPQVTLTVDINIIVESVPDSGDVKDLALASMSPQYDPSAIELLSHVINELPPGVPVCQNASGDWFKTVAAGLEDWAPVIGRALGTFGVPGADLVGASLGKLGKWGNDTGVDKMLALSKNLKEKAKITADKNAASKAK